MTWIGPSGLGGTPPPVQQPRQRTLLGGLADAANTMQSWMAYARDRQRKAADDFVTAEEAGVYEQARLDTEAFGRDHGALSAARQAKLDAVAKMRAPEGISEKFWARHGRRKLELKVMEAYHAPMASAHALKVEREQAQVKMDVHNAQQGGLRVALEAVRTLGKGGSTQEMAEALSIVGGSREEFLGRYAKIYDGDAVRATAAAEADWKKVLTGYAREKLANSRNLLRDTELFMQGTLPVALGVDGKGKAVETVLGPEFSADERQALVDDALKQRNARDNVAVREMDRRAELRKAREDEAVQQFTDRNLADGRMDAADVELAETLKPNVRDRVMEKANRMRSAQETWLRNSSEYQNAQASIELSIRQATSAQQVDEALDALDAASLLSAEAKELKALAERKRKLLGDSAVAALEELQPSPASMPAVRIRMATDLGVEDARDASDFARGLRSAGAVTPKEHNAFLREVDRATKRMLNDPRNTPEDVLAAKALAFQTPGGSVELTAQILNKGMPDAVRTFGEYGPAMWKANPYLDETVLAFRPDRSWDPAETEARLMRSADLLSAEVERREGVQPEAVRRLIWTAQAVARMAEAHVRYAGKEDSTREQALARSARGIIASRGRALDPDPEARVARERRQRMDAEQNLPDLMDTGA